MTVNSFYKCDYCECCLRFRYQVGAFTIPVSVYCPKCNCHIVGQIDPGNSPSTIKESIIGATKIDNDDYEYMVELSTEFIVDKCQKKEDASIYRPSMFLRSNPFDEERNDRRINLLRLAEESEYYINAIENIYNLLEKNEIDLIRKYFLEANNGFLNAMRKETDYSKVINKLDAILAVKHFINNLLMPAMPEGVFKQIYEIMNTKVRRILKNYNKEVIDYLNSLSSDYFETYLFRIPKFFTDYIRCIKQLIPVYDNYSSFDSLDLNTSGISTLSVDEMTVVYKKGYELLCDSIDLVVGLYNIETYGAYNDFGNGFADFSKKLNGYNSKFTKYQDVTNNQSDLFDGIRNKLNSIIRNAEGHNSIKIDGLNQEITFINNHKGKTNTLKLPFLEFGKACIDLFVAVLFIWEYFYNIVRFKAVFVDGLKLNYGKK